MIASIFEISFADMLEVNSCSVLHKLPGIYWQCGFYDVFLQLLKVIEDLVHRLNIY